MAEKANDRPAERRTGDPQSKCDGRSLEAGADSTDARGASGADMPAAATAGKTGWYARARTMARAKLPASAHTQPFRQRINTSLAKNPGAGVRGAYPNARTAACA